MKSEAKPVGAPALGVTPPGGAQRGPAKPAGTTAAVARRRGGGFFSHLFSAFLGAAIVLGAGYAALTGQIPNFSLADPQTSKDLRQLQERVSGLDYSIRNSTSRPSGDTVSSPGAGAGVEVVNEVRARLDGVVQASRTLDETVQALSARVQALEQRTAAAPAPSGELQAEIGRLTTPIAARLAALERDVEGINKTQNDRQFDARSAALTLALTNLKRAVSDGRPFASELAAVENLSSTKLPVSQLATFKDTGVPSLAGLTRDFAAASKKAIEKFYRGNANSIVGEMFSRAKAAIQVKPGDGTGSSVEAIIGRMDEALKTGNVKAAVTEGGTLQGPAQEEMHAWLQGAQARVTAEDTLQKTDQDLLAALTKTTSRRQ